MEGEHEIVDGDQVIVEEIVDEGEVCGFDRSFTWKCEFDDSRSTMNLKCMERRSFISMQVLWMLITYRLESTFSYQVCSGS